MARPKKDLLDASKLLAYEVWMLQKTASALATGKIDPWQRNAVLESFVIHLRNLLDFFYPRQTLRVGDMIAKHFLPKDVTLDLPTSIGGNSIQKLKKRAHKEIAHLTYDRLEVTPNTKGWPFADIHDAMMEVIQSFLSHVDRSNLSPEFTALSLDTQLKVSGVVSTSTSSGDGVVIEAL